MAQTTSEKSQVMDGARQASSIVYDVSPADERAAREAGNDAQRSAIRAAQDTIAGKRDACVAKVPEWEDFRNRAAAIRDQVINNLDYYLAEFVRNARAAGADVRFAPTAEDACDEVLDVLRSHGVTRAVKSKSMVSEEVGINEFLSAHGIAVVESDCAENILQTSGEHPSHIVVPAIHNDRDSIAELFHERRGYEGSNDPGEICHFLREDLRGEFTRAEAGITGCNFGIAETGTCTLVTNEGNARMASTLPPVQVVLMGIGRLLPDLRSLDVLLELLVRSAVGAKLTSCVSLNTGARRDGEGDGPASVHIVLVDNGRSRVLSGDRGREFRLMLRCIRCGACMNACPVYRNITGHGYGSIYPGPMGVVLTPLLAGYEAAGDLADACTLCGACANVCPVKISLNDLIIKHRVNQRSGTADDETVARYRDLASLWGDGFEGLVTSDGVSAGSCGAGEGSEA